MRIIHLGQYHYVNTELSIDFWEQVVQSQFAIAKIIQQNPYCPVVCEATDRNRKRHEYKDNEGLSVGKRGISFQEMRQIFPLGLPNSYADLNNPQKDALYAFGGTLVLFFLNIIPALYRSADEMTAGCTRHFVANDMQKALDSRIGDAEYQRKLAILNLMREENALVMCQQAVAAHFNNAGASSSVILVYGGMHNFKPLCDEKKIDCRKIYTCPVPANRPLTYEEIYTDNAPFWLPTEICAASDLTIHPKTGQLKSSGHSKYRPKMFQPSAASNKPLEDKHLENKPLEGMSLCCTIS